MTNFQTRGNPLLIVNRHIVCDKEVSMIQKRILITVVLATLLLGIVPVLSIAGPAPEQPTQPVLYEGELLRNGDFEEDWGNAQSHQCTIFPVGGGSYEQLVGNIFTPPGWVTWFRHQAGTWDQPEVTDAHKTIDARRVHSGAKGVRLFTFWRDHDAGFYQVVSGLQPGATVQFSAYGEGWSCGEDNSSATSCGDDPYSMVFAVGIAPSGEINPYSPNTIWSAFQVSHNSYSLIGPVTAQVGESGTVVVFLRSVTKWKYKHQDAYWDDASLVYTEPPAEPTSAAPPPPAAPAGPPPTAMPLPTAQPDGSIVYTVQSGDTLFGISLKFGVPLDQIRQLNAGSLGGTDIIRPGQQLVIALPSETPVPTAPPEPTPAEAATGGGASTGEQPATGEEATTGVSVCVLAFHDRDGDTLRGDPEVEELLPNAKFLLADATGLINQYTTDGMQEPYCFTGLAAGSYRVIQQPPAGYTPSDQTEQTVFVAEGTRAEASFGYVRDEDAALAGNSADSAAGADGSSGWLRSAFSTLFKVGGVLVLLMCAGGVVLFILNQRRMNM
jgi:hypothetical protein